MAKKTKAATKRVLKMKNRSMIIDGVKVPIAGTSIVERIGRGPIMRSLGMRTEVRNCELITTISTIALGVFNTNRDALGPFNKPWLSGVASSFSKWRWIFCKYVYIPVCPTTTAGQVVLGLGYDFADNAPGSLQDAQAKFRSVTSPVWAGFDGSSDLNRYTKGRSPGSVSVEVDVNRLGGTPGDPWFRFANSGNFAGYANTDKNIYCPGYLDVSTAGGGATTTIVGNLFVEYIIELIEPIVAANNA
nr:structural protein [Tolivirales sp.]